MAKLGDHPGFKAVQAHIAEAGNMPMEAAGAVLGKSTRDASAAAKRRNPRLNRVKGGSSPTTNVSSLFKGGG
jgi:hypothetical protein